MPTTGHVPSGDPVFLEREKVLLAYLPQNFSAFNVPGTKTTLIPLAKKFEAAFETCQNPNRGKPDTQRKNEARKKFESELRKYNKAYLSYTPVITGDNQTAMGLPVYMGMYLKELIERRT